MSFIRQIFKSKFVCSIVPKAKITSNIKLFCKFAFTCPNLDYERTYIYWRNWIAENSRYSTYQEMISKSAFTLKLLSYDKIGAILAAATTSFPETIGEVRNWDYRFCWIRNASMVVKVFYQLGQHRMVQCYLQFIVDIIPNKDEKLQIMYGINKEKNLTDYFLDHLSGYSDLAPVREGMQLFLKRKMIFTVF